MKKKIRERLEDLIRIPRIKLDEKDVEITLLELKKRVGPPKLSFSKRGSIK